MFGPDRNLPLFPALTKHVILPEGHAWSISTSFDADFEVAIIIYDAVTMRAVHTFGNHSRSNPGSSGPALGPVRGDWNLLLTGWHKNSKPKVNKPWFQSRSRLRKMGTTGIRFSIDDGFNDGDFNDGILTLTEMPVQIL